MRASGWLTGPATAWAVGLATVAPAIAQPASLDIKTGFGMAPAHADPGATAELVLHVEVPGEYHFQAHEPLDEFLIPTVLTIDPPPAGFAVKDVAYPEPIMFEVAGEPAAVLENVFEIVVTLEVGPDAGPGVHPFEAVLAYQACNSQLCLMPTDVALRGAIEIVERDGRRLVQLSGAPPAPPPDEPADDSPPTGAAGAADAVAPGGECDELARLDQFTVLQTSGGYMGAAEFIEFIDAAETGKAQRSWFEGKGPIAIVLLIILGGIALNLTPCVLPLVPINIAIIGAGAQAGSRARGFALGGTYGLAMAVVYGALGLVVTLTAASFGAINSTVWFNVAIAALFVVLALGMFDVITIDFSKLQGKLDLAGSGRRGTFALAFGMGAVTALLAGACVAPVVIQVIVYSGDQYAKGQTLALALPFFLGIGMALPWPFAGAGLSLLPRPGKWMVWIKKGMGVFILIFAGYYGYLAWRIWDSTNVDPDAVRTAVNSQLEGGWTSSLCQGLATAQAEDKLVLVDMWATWCKNCLAMDKTTFKDPEVVARLEDYVKVKYQAENIGVPPARTMLERFRLPGLPAYAILRPGAPGDQARAATSPAERR